MSQKTGARKIASSAHTTELMNQLRDEIDVQSMNMHVPTFQECR